MQFQYKPCRLFAIIVCVLVIGVGCTKVDAPVTQLVTTSVFSNPITATSAVTNIYQKLYTECYAIEWQTGMLSDELTNYNNGALQIQCYKNAMLASSNIGPWNNAYNYIYQANAIIEGLSDNRNIVPAINKQLTGEAKFMRAFWHFYLTNIYGDIPLVLSTDYNANKSISRTPVSSVYQQIIADLKDAQSLLNSGYVDVTDTAVYPIATAERVRPTKSAASALLARVYLYSGDYVNAEIQASAVINNTAQFTLLSDLTKVFLKNSKEAVWQIQTPSTSSNTPEKSFLLTSVPTQQAISPQLLAAFETNDARKSKWVNSYSTTTNPVKIYYFPFKYQAQTAGLGTASTEYVMVLRFSEQYLIRAEAEANGAGGGLTAAIIDLNLIRNRAGLPNYSGATDKASVLVAIQHERQVELFTEWGHRWFDLIRTGAVNSVMGAPGNVTQSKGGTWVSTSALFPLPSTEFKVNKSLTQNPGY